MSLDCFLCTVCGVLMLRRLVSIPVVVVIVVFSRWSKLQALALQTQIGAAAARRPAQCLSTRLQLDAHQYTADSCRICLEHDRACLTGCLRQSVLLYFKNEFWTKRTSQATHLSAGHLKQKPCYVTCSITRCGCSTSQRATQLECTLRPYPFWFWRRTMPGTYDVVVPRPICHPYCMLSFEIVLCPPARELVCRTERPRVLTVLCKKANDENNFWL
jgi:hypothetical protein